MVEVLVSLVAVRLKWTVEVMWVSLVAVRLKWKVEVWVSLVAVRLKWMVLMTLLALGSGCYPAPVSELRR